MTQHILEKFPSSRQVSNKAKVLQNALIKVNDIQKSEN